MVFAPSGDTLDISPEGTGTGNTLVLDQPVQIDVAVTLLGATQGSPSGRRLHQAQAEGRGASEGQRTRVDCSGKDYGVVIT